MTSMRSDLVDMMPASQFFRRPQSGRSATSATESYIVYGRMAPGNNLWAYPEEAVGRTIAISGPRDNPAKVQDPTVGIHVVLMESDALNILDDTIGGRKAQFQMPCRRL